MRTPSGELINFKILTYFANELIANLNITDSNIQTFLRSNDVKSLALYDYLRINSWSTENKDFIKWAVGYLFNNQTTVDFEEFKNEYLHGFNFNNPVDAPQEAIINNGIEILDAPLANSIGPKPLIGFTTNRNNMEDLTYGTNHNADGVRPEVLNWTDNQLFNSLNTLMDNGTTFDSELRQVAHQFVDNFRNNNNPQNTITNPVLNRKTNENIKFINFLKGTFGDRFRDELTRVNGNINNISPIPLGNSRPIFGDAYNFFHGLTILINDTEQTNINLESFELIPNSGGKWIAVVEVTILDHFGVDKNDVLSKQQISNGFAAWWVLQHRRGYVPFVTKVVIRKTLIGYL